MRTRPSPALFRLSSIFAATLCLVLSVSASAETVSRPNIILIVADDLGYGDLGCYGQEKIPTPHLDRLAREGMRFTRFYAGSTVCAPSRNVLMTGQHTGHALIRGNAKLALRPEDVTVAEVLRDAGYTTALVGKWGLGGAGTTGTPGRQGFDHFFGYLDQTHAHNYFPTFLVRNEERMPLRNVVPKEGALGQGVASVRVDYSAQLIADEAVAWLGRQSGRKPFFLYFAPTLPHANNEAGKQGMEIPSQGEFARKDWPENARNFAAMVAQLDRDVGRIRAELERLGLAETTLILFTSDNGPHREGGHDPGFFDSNGPLRGLKRDLFEGGIRVPFIAWWPGRVPAGSTTDQVGWHADILATAGEIAGVRVPPGDGRSLAPTLQGRAPTDRGPLYWEFYEGRSAQAVVEGSWKAIRSPMFVGQVELYDLASDLGETTDLAERHPELVRRFSALMDRMHTPSPHWTVRR